MLKSHLIHNALAYKAYARQCSDGANAHTLTAARVNAICTRVTSSIIQKYFISKPFTHTSSLNNGTYKPHAGMPPEENSLVLV